MPRILRRVEHAKDDGRIRELRGIIIHAISEDYKLYQLFDRIKAKDPRLKEVQETMDWLGQSGIPLLENKGHNGAEKG